MGNFPAGMTLRWIRGTAPKIGEVAALEIKGSYWRHKVRREIF